MWRINIEVQGPVGMGHGHSRASQGTALETRSGPVAATGRLDGHLPDTGSRRTVLPGGRAYRHHDRVLRERVLPPPACCLVEVPRRLSLEWTDGPAHRGLGR